MLTLKAKIRKELGKKVKNLRKKGVLPAVLYGPKIKNLLLGIDFKEFEKIYKEAGESTLISMEIEGQNAKPQVLIHEVKRDPLTDQPLHVDFYQPILTKEIEATVPLIFKGEAPAVKELGGTLVKEIQEIKVKALPQNLPHQIEVDVEVLKTFEDEILTRDLKLPAGVKVLKEPEEIIASCLPPERVEEELEKPIEEKLEEIEKVEKEKKEGEEKEEKEAPEVTQEPQ